jgi:hypothetical protein
LDEASFRLWKARRSVSAVDDGLFKKSLSLLLCASDGLEEYDEGETPPRLLASSGGLQVRSDDLLPSSRSCDRVDRLRNRCSSILGARPDRHRRSPLLRRERPLPVLLLLPPLLHPLSVLHSSSPMSCVQAR